MAEGFEPSEGGYPSHAFEACSLGRSDTPPQVTLPEHPAEPEIERFGSSEAGRSHRTTSRPRCGVHRRARSEVSAGVRRRDEAAVISAGRGRMRRGLRRNRIRELRRGPRGGG